MVTTAPHLFVFHWVAGIRRLDTTAKGSSPSPAQPRNRVTRW